MSSTRIIPREPIFSHIASQHTQRYVRESPMKDLNTDEMLAHGEDRSRKPADRQI